MIAEGAKHVLILDLDAHCGGGTHSLVENLTNVWHLDIAVNEYDIYVPSGHNSLDLVTDHQDYLPVVKSRLSSLDQKAPGFDICLYNAGMDPHEGCTIGGLKGITLEVLREREYLVFEWFRQRRVPIAFVIAGGYTSVTLNQSGLVQLHRLTLEAAAMVFCR